MSLMHCFAGCHTCLQTKPPKLLSQHLYWDNQKRQHAQGFLLCHCKVWQQEQLFLCNINKKATIKTKDYTNDEFLFFSFIFEINSLWRMLIMCTQEWERSEFSIYLGNISLHDIHNVNSSKECFCWFLDKIQNMWSI